MKYEFVRSLLHILLKHLVWKLKAGNFQASTSGIIQEELQRGS